jgi:large subunit ribosomal protein L23
MRDPYQIIERPLLTEKSMDLSHSGKYTFRVASDANKIEIAEAIEKMYKVKVTKVNTLTVRGKMTNRGMRASRKGRTPDWKKAIVTLAPGQTITLFEGL